MAGRIIPSMFNFQVMVTTYEMITSGLVQLKMLPWRAAIFDEAHKLKNRNSKIVDTVRQYRIDHRVLLTGTPLQNSLEEVSMFFFFVCVTILFIKF